MYIFPVLGLRVGLLLLIWMASWAIFGSLFSILVYYLEMGDVGLEMIVGNAVFVNCTGNMTILFFYSTSAGFSYVRKV